ncbi:hypothetical protein ACOTHJ_13340 [Achromobacter xylosoxidans]|uniref:hypothetical protein n=1 Tax=Achromobacter anxifer TaxID=1287737 RepID=UPI00155C0081|nr:hypothetical protein [Achromobacter anxifer]CAB5514673.1 hypothetical protein LMG26857_03732 [Achromobacter anxifer]
MNLVVVRMFQHPRDTSRKHRYAVVLGMVNGRVAVAPCTSYPARTGLVPQGSSLITKDSPAFASTGFTVDKVAISIRDTGLYSIDSTCVRRCKQVGTLNTELDRHLAENLKQLMREYDLLHAPTYA